MAQLTVVYWRDIPAQVLVGSGRRAARVQLSDRFEKAIDRAAMVTGAAETDAYLADWHRVTEGDVDGGQTAADTRAAQLEAEWTPERLKTVALAGGYETERTT